MIYHLIINKMQTCIGIKQCGVRCSVVVFDEGRRCGVHQNTLNNLGPNTTRRRELKYIHDRNVKLLSGQYHDLGAAVYERRQTQEVLRYQQALLELNTLIAQETEANGDVDHDLEARNRANNRRRQAHDARADRLRQRHQMEAIRRQQFLQENAHVIAEVANAIAAGDDPERQLRAIALDRQNVHTTEVVTKVKEVISKVLKIVVPPEYETETLKTSGEIILECKLSKRAAWQMMAKYCGDEEIYDMGPGIYAKVLNSVWQFIKASPDAEDLKKILSAEMEDNVGMCAQGNLSRLCNILSGYIEGIDVDVKSTNQILGERLSALLEEEDVNKRIEQAGMILRALRVPDDQWVIWTQPLIEA